MDALAERIAEHLFKRMAEAPSPKPTPAPTMEMGLELLSDPTQLRSLVRTVMSTLTAPMPSSAEPAERAGGPTRLPVHRERLDDDEGGG